MSYKPDFAYVIPKIQGDSINNSGVTITKVTPVYIDASGLASTIDVSDESKSTTIAGVTLETSNSGSTLTIVSTGKVENVGFLGFSYGDVIYVSKTGNLTNIKPSLVIDGGAFNSGDFIVRIGVIARNQTNALEKDLLLNIQVMGQI